MAIIAMRKRTFENEHILKSQCPSTCAITAMINRTFENVCRALQRVLRAIVYVAVSLDVCLANLLQVRALPYLLEQGVLQGMARSAVA